MRSEGLLVLVVVLAACGVPTAGRQDKSTGGALVGVTMPTTTVQRWNQDGQNIKRDLEARGHRVDLKYAENNAPDQVPQTEDQIALGAKLLIIASVDGSAHTRLRRC
ncbi:hypothetical protein [Lentzea sp. E54]|uniref:hypothetical protein n=1 Tax=Lentzea xerophila TaxID=3435883 RepID=UPI003DA59C59